MAFRRTFGIAGALLIALVPLSLAAFNRNVSQATARSTKFQWDWRDARELKADQVLRNANLAKRGAEIIAAAILSELRQNPPELENETDTALRQIAMNTRIEMTDLNHDQVPEVIAQPTGDAECSPTGNCPFWIFQKADNHYRTILRGDAQTFTVQKTTADGFADIVLAVHDSATESGLALYRYRSGVYRSAACYDASWTAKEDPDRLLQAPLVTACPE